MAYPFREIEEKWQTIWRQNHPYRATNKKSSSPKAYILEMFPYPSGRVHMGHARNYAMGDVIARWRRAQGYDVLHPMGWDSFGLPAENAALAHGISPAVWTESNILSMKTSLHRLGLAIDWEREITSCHSSYYGLGQRLFLDFYGHQLAYRRESWVNWDPVDQCVLANEQVIDGKGWRSGAVVEKRRLQQWSLKITAYAERLLKGLSTLSKWPEKVIRMQENWIGRSQGALILFEGDILKEYNLSSLEVFSTRPETLFGATFLAIAPTHPLSERLASHHPSIAEFIHQCQQTSTTEENLSTLDPKGIQTGICLPHPFLPHRNLPVYIANFVVMDYGAGAIFGCPAHDERDYAFAQQYDLPLIPVIQPLDPQEEKDSLFPYTGEGVVMDSGPLNGLTVQDARAEMIKQLEASGKGKAHLTYRLRDWCVSRQRYWGCPIPIVHCPQCGEVPVPPEHLPVVLPEDTEILGKGKNPLEEHPTWKHVTCPQCEGKAVRETDTLDTFFESSWYFLRFCDPHSSLPVNREAVEKWMPVDCYIGGIEHAVLHLLYARFFTYALKDFGYLDREEPFEQLLTQGMVCHQTFKNSVSGEWLYPDEVEKNEKGAYVTLKERAPVQVGRSEKMSKSKKNLVDLETILMTYGADTARLFTLSDTPPDRDFDWTEEGIEGAWRYLNRFWNLGETFASLMSTRSLQEETGDGDLTYQKALHAYIQKITQGYETHSFNKVIAWIRELTRLTEEAMAQRRVSRSVLREGWQTLIQLIAPFTPHISAELWVRAQEGVSASPQVFSDLKWPVADPLLASAETVTVTVQVNGKKKGSLELPINSSEETLLSGALALQSVKKELDGRTIRRQIIVPNRIINLVL